MAKAKTPPSVASQIRSANIKAAREGHKTALWLHLRRFNLPHPQVEYYFHATRKWQIDFVWWYSLVSTREEIKVALEIEGGTHMEEGGHRSWDKYSRDLDKYNQLAVYGYRLLRLLPEQLQLRDDTGINLILKVVKWEWNDRR